MPSIEEILAKAEDPAYHRVVTARVSFVPQALRDEHAELSALLPTLISDTIDAHPDRNATAERLAEIEAEFEANEVEFRFQNIGRRAWADLLRKHPPTQEQLRRDKHADHNSDTFPYEAMAASCVEPQMSVEQVHKLDESKALDVDGWTKLWGACVRANVLDVVPKSVAAELIRLRNGASATQLTNSEFPAASSSDE
jgi:hypothetical protein